MKLFSYLPKTSNFWLFGSFLFITYGASMRQRPTAGIIDHFKVGDIVYSILKEEDFIKLHGSGWRSLSPIQSLTGTDLNKFYGVSVLPEGRGTFIRGMNLGGGYDPDNRAVGSYQADDFKSHNHSINDGPAKYGDIINNSLNFYNENVGRKYALRTDNTGGVETRPRNIALYIYIKVNEQVN